MTKVIKFVAFAVAGSLVATRLMSATQILAAEVTGYALGQIGALGQAGQAAFGRVMNSGMMFGGIATMLGGAA
ncbi:hypothetical protein ABTE23_21560, partial [Acinetobacter baumannii]